MKTLSFAVAAILASSAVLADGPLAYPGSSWGAVIAPSSVMANTPETGNVLYMGKITQGIDWYKFGKFTFDTYASFTISDDHNHLSYNDKMIPAVGMRVDRHFGDGIVTLGVEESYEHHWGDGWDGRTLVSSSTPGMNGAGVQAYVSYWFGWNLKGK
jgi:hypothetical protein